MLEDWSPKSCVHSWWNKGGDYSRLVSEGRGVWIGFSGEGGVCGERHMITGDVHALSAWHSASWFPWHSSSAPALSSSTLIRHQTNGPPDLHWEPLNPRAKINLLPSSVAPPGYLSWSKPHTKNWFPEGGESQNFTEQLRATSRHLFCSKNERPIPCMPFSWKVPETFNKKMCSELWQLLWHVASFSSYLFVRVRCGSQWACEQPCVAAMVTFY